MSSLANSNTPGRNTKPHENSTWKEPAPYSAWGKINSTRFAYEKDKELVDFCKANEGLPKDGVNLEHSRFYKNWRRREQQYFEAYEKTGDEDIIHAFLRLETWIVNALGKKHIYDLFRTKRAINRRERLVKYTPPVEKAEEAMAKMTLEEKKENVALYHKYYTLPERVTACVATIQEAIKIDQENDLIIEPSAGDGRWIPYLKTLCKNVEAYDIKPDVPEVKKMDFLEYVAPEKKGKIHVIGNPPWKGGLEGKFIEKCVKFADSICFLLPAKYLKRDNLELFYNADGSLHKTIYHLPLQYHPVNVELLSGEKFDGLYNRQEVAFIVWMKKDTNRPTIKMPPNKNEIYEKISHKHRKEADVKISMIDGKCSPYNVEEDDDDSDSDEDTSRYFYFRIRQMRIPFKTFVEEFNVYTEEHDSYIERSYSRKMDRVSMFDVLTALNTFWENIPADIIHKVAEEAKHNRPAEYVLYRKHLQSKYSGVPVWIRVGCRARDGMVIKNEWAYKRNKKDKPWMNCVYDTNPEEESTEAIAVVPEPQAKSSSSEEESDNEEESDSEKESDSEEESESEEESDEDDKKMPAEEDALQKVTNIDREHFKEGGYYIGCYRKWEDGKEPPNNCKWVDEYFASALSGFKCFVYDGFKTPPSVKKFERLYRRTYTLENGEYDENGFKDYEHFDHMLDYSTTEYVPLKMRKDGAVFFEDCESFIGYLNLETNELESSQSSGEDDY